MLPYGLIRNFKITSAVLEVELKRRRDYAATEFERHGEQENLKTIAIMRDYVAEAEAEIETDYRMAGFHLRAAQALFQALKKRIQEV